MIKQTNDAADTPDQTNDAADAPKPIKAKAKTDVATKTDQGLWAAVKESPYTSLAVGAGLVAAGAVGGYYGAQYMDRRAQADAARLGIDMGPAQIV